MATFQRVALYILFDAVERDLIEHIRRATLDCDTILSADERKKAIDIAERRAELGQITESDLDLLLNLDVGQKYDVLMRHKASLGSLSEYFSSLRGHFTRIISVRNDVMHGRMLTIDQQVYALAFTQHLLRSPQMWPGLSTAFQRYTQNPSEFLNQSITFLEEGKITSTLHNLPIPDYDDTGWLPRVGLETQLKKRILGRHPIVTVQGDGGNGKTALALQVLHNLVHTNEHSFDAILWFSAKTATISHDGISEIDGAISNASEIVENLASWEPGEGSPESRLRRLLEDNRILLVIDNYETIVGGDIYDLAIDAPGDSKFLFTSRHPVGGDLVIKVEEFDASDAKKYLYRLFDVYGLAGYLQTYNSGDFDNWAERLHYKPLSLKWLALGIKSGLNPERLVLEDENLLAYCLENVAAKLSPEAKAVSVVLSVLPVRAAPSVIGTCGRLNATQVTDGLAELARFNMVEVSISEWGTQEFRIRPFARSYINRVIQPREELLKQISKNYRAIEAEYQASRHLQDRRRYSFHYFEFSSRDQMLLTNRLKEAIDYAYGGRPEEAENILYDCKRLDPTFFEVHRAEAVIAHSQSDLTRSLDAIREAVKLAPEKPQLHYFEGSILLRMLENDRAALAFEKALDIEESFYSLKAAARNEIIRCNFENARILIDRLSTMGGLGTKQVRERIDVELQYFSRKAEHLCRSGFNEQSAEEIENLAKFLRTIRDNQKDELIEDHAFKALTTVRELELRLDGWQAGEELRSKIYAFLGEAAHRYDARASARGSTRGFIKFDGLQATFGFLESEGAPDVFIHRRIVSEMEWAEIIRGAAVWYDYEPSGNGKFRALNVEVEVRGDDLDS